MAHTNTFTGKKLEEFTTKTESIEQITSTNIEGVHDVVQDKDRKFYNANYTATRSWILHENLQNNIPSKLFLLHKKFSTKISDKLHRCQ